MAFILYYSYNYLVCKDAYQGVREPPSAAVRGRTAGSEQGGLKPGAGKIHCDEDFGKSLLGAADKES